MNRVRFSLLILLWAAAANAADKPQVAVRFKVEASAYRQHFGARTSTVESRAADAVVKALKQHMQFADFSSSGTGSPQYVLNLSLAVPDATADVATQPVWLMASLSKAGGTSGPRWRWRKFREAAADCGGLSADTDCTWPDEGDFLTALRALLAPSSLYPALVSNVFQEISIIDSGKFVVQPLNGWVLPFRQEELCLGTNTQLRIVNDIPTDQITLHGKFRAAIEGPYGHPPDSIFTTLADGEDAADNNKKALLQQFPDKVVVRGVYLVQYQHLDENCGGAIAPPTAPAGEGGSQ